MSQYESVGLWTDSKNFSTKKKGSGAKAQKVS